MALALEIKLHRGKSRFAIPCTLRRTLHLISLVGPNGPILLILMAVAST